MWRGRSGGVRGSGDVSGYIMYDHTWYIFSARPLKVRTRLIRNMCCGKRARLELDSSTSPKSPLTTSCLSDSVSLKVPVIRVIGFTLVVGTLSRHLPYCVLGGYQCHSCRALIWLLLHPLLCMPLLCLYHTLSLFRLRLTIIDLQSLHLHS